MKKLLLSLGTIAAVAAPVAAVVACDNTASQPALKDITADKEKYEKSIDWDSLLKSTSRTKATILKTEGEKAKAEIENAKTLEELKLAVAKVKLILAINPEVRGVFHAGNAGNDSFLDIEHAGEDLSFQDVVDKINERTTLLAEECDKVAHDFHIIQYDHFVVGSIGTDVEME